MNTLSEYVFRIFLFVLLIESSISQKWECILKQDVLYCGNINTNLNSNHPIQSPPTELEVFTTEKEISYFLTQKLPGLTVLTIHATENMTYLNKDVTKYALNLKSLNLRGNCLDKIEPATFSNSTKLESLDLSANFFETFNGSDFYGLTNLKSLNLQQNRLTSFKYSFNRGLALTLLLQFNQFETLTKVTCEINANLKQSNWQLKTDLQELCAISDNNPVDPCLNQTKIIENNSKITIEKKTSEVKQLKDELHREKVKSSDDRNKCQSEVHQKDNTINDIKVELNKSVGKLKICIETSSRESKSLKDNYIKCDNALKQKNNEIQNTKAELRKQTSESAKKLADMETNLKTAHNKLNGTEKLLNTKSKALEETRNDWKSSNDTFKQQMLNQNDAFEKLNSTCFEREAKHENVSESTEKEGMEKILKTVLMKLKNTEADFISKSETLTAALIGVSISAIIFIIIAFFAGHLL